MRLYSALLRLYPASFRAEYGDEMRAIFAARLRRTPGGMARAKLWMEALGDAAFNAAAVHWDVLRQDLRYTGRSLGRSPGFALTAVLVTALGIGANTAAFSLADYVFLRPLPYGDADRLVKLWQDRAQQRRPGNQPSPAVYREWKASSRSFEAMGAYYGGAVNLVGDGEPQRLEASFVTHDLLPVLGVKPVVGRLFSESEALEGESGPVVLSYGVWQSQFGGDPSLVGRRILLDGNPRVVIGVMPEEFRFPRREVGIWRLMTPQEMSDEDVTNTYWEVVARLRPGVSLEAASAEMDVIGRRMQAQYPDELEDIGVFVNPLRNEISTQSRLLLLALCGAAGCVLLIACANLANLLLARALVRRREVLVRTALGAGRERLVRASITESLVLAALGGALGVAVAYGALPLLTRLVPDSLPIGASPAIDPRVLGFAALLTAVAGLGFGVVPVWRSSGKLDLTDLGATSRAGGGRRARARSALVVAEVAMSVVLLISAGLLLRAVVRIQSVDPGFRAERVLTMRTALTEASYPDIATRAAFYREVVEEVRALPGVSGAAYITSLPIAQTGGVWPVVPEGQELSRGQAERATSRFVTPGYFATMGIPLRRGRDVSERDGTDQPWVAVVSESFVQRYWPGQDPIGKRFSFGPGDRTVVGVVGDVRMRGPERVSEPQVYLSHLQIPEGVDGTGAPITTARFYAPRDLVIRTTAPTASVVPAVRRIVQRVDPRQPVSNVKTMSDIVDEVTAARAVQLRLLVAFAAIAVLLAGIGIHGLLSYTVLSQQREIGVRLALGARQREVVRLIMTRGVALTVAGVVPGLAIAYAGGLAMRNLLAGVQPGDPATFLGAGALCTMMALLGSLLPTLRAARVDPATALRAEA
jgi:putative ABC transport system permease protein